jgi:23S rRNA pseudouridine1911/1915/1917 synthase
MNASSFDIGQLAEREVIESLDGARLDAAVRELWKVSWGRARSLIEGGKVFADGALCLDIARCMRSGETIELRMHARRPRPPTEIDRGILLHLDDHIVVVRKPSGIATVPFKGMDRSALDEQLRRLLSNMDGDRRSGGRRPNLFVVHRLDRGTSGVLVFARSAMARERLARQFREHSAQRRYLAIAHGQVSPGRIESHLVTDRGDGIRGSSERAKHLPLRRQGGGKRAVTHVEVIEALRGATLLSCRLETGRTNQIRIHLSEAGHPLVGETLYLREFKGEAIPAPRLMLHAAELGFLHPATEQFMLFEEPMPQDMGRVLASLKRTS